MATRALVAYECLASVNNSRHETPPALKMAAIVYNLHAQRRDRREDGQRRERRKADGGAADWGKRAAHGC